MVPKYLLVCTFIFISFISVVEAKPTCDAPETLEYHDDYNNYVCSGISNFQVGLYSDAIKQYESAQKLHLHEYPNFMLNARIAHAYLLKGDIKQASDYIQRSEISLSVLSGIYTCEYYENDFPFISANGRTPIESDLAPEIAITMCSEAHLYVYNARSKNLRAVVADGLLTQYHLLVAGLVAQRIALNNK